MNMNNRERMWRLRITALDRGGVRWKLGWVVTILADEDYDYISHRLNLRMEPLEIFCDRLHCKSILGSTANLFCDF